MTQPAVPTEQEQSISIGPNLTKAVEQLVDRAKVDRDGVFWTLAPNYRQTESARFENSLGYGTPGVLLTLLRYFELSRDPEIGSILEKGTNRLSARVKSSPTFHGYYGGSGGLWHVLAELERGEFSTEWRPAMNRWLEAEPKPGEGASLAFGLAGSIVGTLAAVASDTGFDHDRLRSFATRLVGTARLSSQGVFWDFSQTSQKPPLGFILGSAGVDYCFAHLNRLTGWTCAPLVRASIEHANQAFDATRSNWPDFDTPPEPPTTDQDEARKRLEKGLVVIPDGSTDTVSFGSGTCGILIARQAVASSYRNLEIAEVAAQDLKRASARLCRISPEQIDGLDMTLMGGLPGFVLAMANSTRKPIANDTQPLRGLLERCQSRLSTTPPPAPADDVGLLSGLSGYLYQAVLSVSDKTTTIVDPLSDLPNPSTATVEQLSLDPIVQNRTASFLAVPDINLGSFSKRPCIQSLDEALAPCLKEDPANIAVRAAAHTLSLHRELESLSFRTLFNRELATQLHYAKSFGEGMDENILFGKFEVSKAVALLELDFDPTSNPPNKSNHPVYVMRKRCSSGIQEAKLSSLQYALATGFHTGGTALEIIHDVIQRVQTPDVTQRQLASLALRLIRGFLAGGILEHRPNRGLSGWLTKRRLNELRTNLFPRQ